MQAVAVHLLPVQAMHQGPRAVRVSQLTISMSPQRLMDVQPPLRILRQRCCCVTRLACVQRYPLIDAGHMALLSMDCGPILTITAKTIFQKLALLAPNMIQAKSLLMSWTT